MNKKKLLAKLEEEIQKSNTYLDSIPDNEYLERGITLGKINGLLIAKLYVLDLEDK